VTVPAVAPAVARETARRPARNARGPIAVALAAAASVALVALRDPHVAGSYGYCPLYVLTGLYCPACGALRATHDLARLDLAAAWSQNAAWVVAVPVLVVGWAVTLVRRLRGAAPRPLPGWVGWTVLGAVVAFGVARNLPALAWLAP
jgi:hypothetical protein